MANKQDVQMDTIRNGQMARLASFAVSDKIREREASLINRAIGLYRNDELTGEKAQMFIAAIAEMRSIKISLDHEAEFGIQAQESVPVSE